MKTPKTIMCIGLILLTQSDLFSQCEECNHFDISIGDSYYTESNCDDDQMTLCSDISVLYPDAYGSWQYGVYSNSQPIIESEILNTHLHQNVTICITESCTASIQFFVKSWTGPDAFGIECATHKTFPRSLPVVFNDFNAEVTTKGIKLQWTTLSEINNDKFVIEKRNGQENFKPIGEIKGSGDSYQEKYYSFLDRQLDPGLNYYRLKQCDNDGHIDYSHVISVLNKQVEQKLIYYPNPVREYLYFNEEVKQIKIMDGFGNGIKILSQGPYHKVNLSDLSPGLYLMEIESKNGSIETKRIVKVD